MFNRRLSIVLHSVILTLMISCGGGGGGSDSTNLGNATPIANAGNDQFIQIGANVNLSAEGSTDADGDSLTYRWVLLSRPAGSGASLSSTTNTTNSFIADIAGDYRVQVTVDDGSAQDSETITVQAQTFSNVPIADAGVDQTITTGDAVTLDGSVSRAPNGDGLAYFWSLTTRPAGSSAALAGTNSVSPSFIADTAGRYVFQLIVNDGDLDSNPDTVTINVNDTANNRIFDDFNGSGPLTNYVTNNMSSLPDITQANGRYRANLVDNSSDITLHFNNFQGRLDAQLVTFPFEAIARNIGIGTQSNSQVAPALGSNSTVIFAGIQVHTTDLSSKNSAHVVVGHRGFTPFTIEGKNTINGSSSVTDAGANAAPLGRADIRIVGNSDKTLTIYWQQPNSDPANQSDSWQLYRGNGALPGTSPAYGDQVYVGLITYAQGGNGVPFVGTSDSFEITF